MSAAVHKQKLFRLPLWAWIVIGAAAAGGLLYYALNQPQYGSWRYGACRVFVEKTQRFPDTIKMLTVMESQVSTRLVYSSINAYGAQRVQDFECYFGTGPNGAPKISKILVDRKPLNDDKVAEFNALLPVILSQEMNTLLPPEFPSKLEDYR